jgi:chromosome segregation ATPase
MERQMRKRMNQMSKIICQCGDVIQPDDDALCGTCALDFHDNKRTIESLKQELAALKKDNTNLKAKCEEQAEEIDFFERSLHCIPAGTFEAYSTAYERMKTEIAQLQDDNRSLVEQMNKMALKHMVFGTN